MKSTILALFFGLLLMACGKGNDSKLASGWSSDLVNETTNKCVSMVSAKSIFIPKDRIERACSCITKFYSERVSVEDVKNSNVPPAIQQQAKEACKQN